MTLVYNTQYFNMNYEYSSTFIFKQAISRVNIRVLIASALLHFTIKKMQANLKLKTKIPSNSFIFFLFLFKSIRNAVPDLVGVEIYDMAQSRKKNYYIQVLFNTVEIIAVVFIPIGQESVVSV